MLGDFLTAIGSGQQSAGSAGFVFDDRARGVYNTYDNAAFAQENDGDTFISSPGTTVDGQKGKDIEAGDSTKKTVTRGKKKRRHLQDSPETTDPATAIPLETFVQQLVHDHVLFSQWIADIHNAPVPYSTFKSDGIKQPQCVTDYATSSFIPPDILGAPPTSRRRLESHTTAGADGVNHNFTTRGGNGKHSYLRDRRAVPLAAAVDTTSS